MAYCKQCGTLLDDGTGFCGKCGSKIEEQNPYAPPKQSVPDFTEKKNPWQYFTGVLKKYAVFQGRARRAEYWWFVLFNIIFSIVASILEKSFSFFVMSNTGVISTLWNLAVFLPSIGVAVRRMHDCDKSGWFILIPIYSLILCCTGGTSGPNRFGPDPKVQNPNPEIAPVT